MANPFGVAKPAQSNAVAQAASDREMSEVQSMMVIAKKFPRDQRAAVDHILLACTRPTLAEGALYSYARGGQEVTGPSIRLAEAMAQEWGNLVFGVRELEQRNGESTVEAYAWDIERNVRQSKTFQVSHIRHTQKGAKLLTDPRDIYEMIANNGARRMRACILSVIPGDVVEAAVNACEVTLKTHCDTSQEAVQRMVEAFEKFGVFKEQIEKRIQRRMDAITPGAFVQLRKIYASIRDGMSAPGEWFELLEPEADKPAPAAKPASVAEAVKAAARAAEPRAATDSQTGERFTFDQLADKVEAATHVDELDLVADLGRQLPKAEAAKLSALIKARVEHANDGTLDVRF